MFAATLTPETKDLAVDHVALADHCGWLLGNGCDGIAVFGTTGEATSFSAKERMDALETLVKNRIPANRLLVGTGCCALPDTVLLTRHAMDLGVGGVLVLPPFYYKGVDDNGVYDAYARVVQQLSDTRLEMYLYHFPQMTGVPLDRDLISRLTTAYPDTIVGIKDSGGDFGHMKMIRQSFPGLRVFPGTEIFLLDLLEMGGAGCISATINVTSRLAAEIHNRWQTDDVRELQQRLTLIRQTFDEFPLIAALKHVMAEHTGSDGWRNVRPPISPLDREQIQRLERALGSISFSVG
ncbi:MAG: dihydrodipicolinate synthase family protein [Candidatus Latescibacterota bacterium]|nr:MAG: dihydrodipicolinate synthase family protein [Candidatus Latescibacterota bacterium]